ncbi:chromophore lyase CRL, chloroplastic isoform X1 [Cryptomeria japonica]|uniref:chromophore lyase CRL, chloroplastic isoform X1 n=1 Tax=Cryptomeria japonica TaxID=3369 RepID=UPI0027DA7F2C|nr:chromophore lyase CRL, chloroplastic isoform X1 [Cryptomeria japonica]XP_057865581.2 chromophore lyase CRL, chloroplastic isoform X1 [Cryptomeria japonica]XP_057865591.2 chromophore lyase CRL, chloroplastic isoform X1 [Cryptomeria japonica]
MVEVICLHEEGGTSSSNEGSNNHNSKKGESRNGSRNIASVVVKALCVAGGFFFMRKLTKSTAPVRVDHSRIVAEALSGEKFSSEQAARDPMTYFNHRMLACPAMEMVNGSKLLYFEQAFWRTPEKPHRQRFFVVKPCPKDMKCDVEVASYAIKNIEEYRNFCARPDSQRPQSDEILGRKLFACAWISHEELSSMLQNILIHYIYHNVKGAGGVCTKDPLHQTVFPICGMVLPTVHQSLLYSGMGKFIAGIGPMTMKEIRSGVPGKALMNSSLYQRQPSMALNFQ